MTDELAKLLLEMTWKELDDFASYISEVATDDAGKPNDERFIASCMVCDAKDQLDGEQA